MTLEAAHRILLELLDMHERHQAQMLTVIERAIRIEETDKLGQVVETEAEEDRRAASEDAGSCHGHPGAPRPNQDEATLAWSPIGRKRSSGQHPA